MCEDLLHPQVGARVPSADMLLARVSEVRVKLARNEMGTVIHRAAIEVIKADIGHAFAQPTVEMCCGGHRMGPLVVLTAANYGAGQQARQRLDKRQALAARRSSLSGDSWNSGCGAAQIARLPTNPGNAKRVRVRLPVF